MPSQTDTLDRPETGAHTVASEALKGTLLSQLRLTDEDLAALERQGIVRIEQRRDRSVAKLRFRRGNRQVVRYLGGPEAGRQVQEELLRWQAAHRKCREMLGLVKAARATLRRSKKALAPCLEQVGYRFHGLAIRRPRKTPAGADRPAAAID